MADSTKEMPLKELGIFILNPVLYRALLSFLAKRKMKLKKLLFLHEIDYLSEKTMSTLQRFVEEVKALADFHQMSNFKK
ncbi:uncharacterized protein FA14DRAFT_160084 [Meira miltonrushii]|uniref:Uncharacterized protein n=1 Tax=Meira miltonrushii TaxID=1280837 RepID=A0A316VG95_9BASI|nr:uncharacterized protein FA14DRAFT_160084 [Meira miltonrushii]PWN34505.1 hypothetical protein FA14DRAFT_160084 [Meira miltonrushii]